MVDGGVGPDGERRQAKRKGFKTKKLAAKALDEIRGKARTASYVPPATITVKKYLEGWLAGLPTRLRPSTIDSYRRCLQYVYPTLGGRRLDSLRPEDLDGLYASLLATGCRQSDRGLSPRTTRYVHNVLRAALADAVKKGSLSRNIADLADPPRAKDCRPPEAKFWQPDELSRFLRLTHDEPLGALFRVAGLCGLRRGEVCGLRWQDVDLDKAEIRIRHTVIVVREPGAPDGGLRFSTPKTDRGKRTIDLDAGTVSALRTEWKRQAEHRLAMGAGWSNEHDLVFVQPDGSPLDPESVGQVFNRRAARHGLPRIAFHGLRHSHVAHLIAAGESPHLIAQRLGHHSASFSLDRYGHLLDRAGSQAASAVAALIDGSSVVG